MPNWCSNVVTISHEDKEKIDILEKEFRKDNENCKPFTLLRPMPDEYKEGDSWYMWNVTNWGTKWEPSVGGDVTRVDDNTLTVIMDTAWSPPVTLYEYMETELDYTVDAYYEECGMAFCGHYSEGFDDYYEYGDMSADELEDNLPPEINEHFGLADRKRDEEDEEEWNDDAFDFDEDESDTEDDPYSMYDDWERTGWFPKKIKPAYLGMYEIKTESWPFAQFGRWDGKKWYVRDVDINEYDIEVKIDEWRGQTENDPSRD